MLNKIKQLLKKKQPLKARSDVKVLFLLKRREDYGIDISYSKDGISTGLLNSATFVKDMLWENLNVRTKLSVVKDNNDIDREVNDYKPTHVIIEALWVVPEKFDVLQKLHPDVTWIIRYHSEMSFLASEGIAMKWTMQYLTKKNVVLGINSPRLLNDISGIAKAFGLSEHSIKNKIVYLPNFYPANTSAIPKMYDTDSDTINISCFGAIRPLKNQLQQAVAAIRFADLYGKNLRFHINHNRVEMKGEPILHNIEGLFDAFPKHELVVHEWCKHEDFLAIIAYEIDIGMQVSFSETFNIVAADIITMGIPMLMSNEVPWAAAGIVNDKESADMVIGLMSIIENIEQNVVENNLYLHEYSKKSQQVWLKYFS